MNVGHIIFSIEKNTGTRFGALLRFAERAMWHRKVAWEFAPDYSTTLSAKYCRLAHTFPDWSEFSQQSNLLHEAAHMRLMHTMGAIPYFTRYAQKDGRLEIELACIAQNVSLGKHLGIYTLVNGSPNRHLESYINHEIDSLASSYYLGDWFDDARRAYARRKIADFAR